MQTEETYIEDYQGEPADAGAPVRPVIHTTHHDDDRPAPVRIAELFERMQPHKQVLRAILKKCCGNPCAFAEVRSEIEALSEHHRSVYAPEGFCDLLERAGALQKVTAEGEPFPKENPEPRVVVEDGVEYLEPVEMPELYFITTADGEGALAADRPASKIEGLFEREERYLPVYKRILQMCAQEGGATMPAMDAAILNDPLVQEPRYYATRFVSNLESVDAVSWEPGWHITEAGLEGLQMLADVEAAGE